MNYREWIERVKVFIERFDCCHPRCRASNDIGPPASLEQIAEAEASIGRPLFRQFRKFLSTASGNCSFGYWWEAESEAEIRAVVSAFEFNKAISGGLEYLARGECLADDYEFHRELVEEGTTEQLFSNPEHPYTRQLMRAREMLDGPAGKSAS